MSIDPSIPLQVRPPQQADPMEMFARMMHIQQQQQQGRILGLKEQEAQRVLAQEEQLRGMFTTGRPSMEQMAAVVGPTRGAEVEQALSKADTEKVKAAMEGWELLGRAFAGVTDQVSYDAVKQQLRPAMPMLQRAGISVDPAFSPDGIARITAQAMSVKDRIAQEASASTQKETARHNVATETNAAAATRSLAANRTEDNTRQAAAAAATQAERTADNRRQAARDAEAARHNVAMETRATAQGGILSPAMESNVLNRLSKQWTEASKPARELERQVRLMDTGIEAAERGDLAQGAQAVLVTFQKILDPTSVVRESEYARSGQGLALDDRIKGAIEKLAKGGAGVPLDELKKFAQLAREAAKAQRGSFLDTVKERIGRGADRYKIPRDLVFESPQAEGVTTEEWVRDASGKLIKKGAK